MLLSASAVTINKHKTVKNKDKMIRPEAHNYKVYIIGLLRREESQEILVVSKIIIIIILKNKIKRNAKLINVICSVLEIMKCNLLVRNVCDKSSVSYCS